MAHPFFFHSGIALGTVLILLGTNALLRPNDHLQRLEFPVPTETQALKLSHALMRIWGVRNLTIGILLALVWNFGDERLMGMALGACVSLPITDGFVSRALIGGGELQHWVFPPIIGFVVVGLFGWFD